MLARQYYSVQDTNVHTSMCLMLPVPLPSDTRQSPKCQAEQARALAITGAWASSYGKVAVNGPWAD